MYVFACEISSVYEHPKAGFFKGSVFVTTEAENFLEGELISLYFLLGFLILFTRFSKRIQIFGWRTPHRSMLWQDHQIGFPESWRPAIHQVRRLEGQWPKTWYPFWPNQNSWVRNLSSKPTISQRNLCISGPMLHLSSPLPLNVSKNPSTRNARNRKLRFLCVKFLIRHTKSCFNLV